MQMQDIIDTAIENLESTYGITFERPIRWAYTYTDAQNKIEELLMRSERLDVARAYIRFRYKKEIR